MTNSGLTVLLPPDFVLTIDNKYFKEFVALTVSVEKALAYFATHPEEIVSLFGRYCEESGLELKQVA
jgi:hypothetical protein